MTQVNDIKKSLRNYIAILLNSLWKWSSDLIKPVSAPIQIGDYWRYTVVKDFSNRVKDF